MLEGETEKSAPEFEFPRILPPVDTVYQLIVLPEEVALRLVLEPLQILTPLDGVTEVGVPGKAFIVNVPVLDVTEGVQVPDTIHLY